MAGLEIKLKPLPDKNIKASLAEMSGAIDGNTVPNFQKTLEEIQNKGVRCLILDMSKIKYVNSTGLGSLVKYADAFKSSGGGMALIKVPAKVKIVIEMLGLNAFFDICQDVEQAKQALASTNGKSDAAKQSTGPITRPPKATPRAVAPPKAPEEPKTTAAPKPRASGGSASFPLVTECKSCGVKLRFTKQGSFKCPRCHTFVKLNGTGEPVFTKPNRSASVSLSLPARAECGEGLLHLATSVCAVGMSDRSLEAVRHAIHEVVQVIQSSIYANNAEGIYHVTIDLNNGTAEIQIADHGMSIDTNRLTLYFPQATRVMDSFECKAHPKGGNIIRMTKGG